MDVVQLVLLKQVGIVQELPLFVPLFVGMEWC
jgi:hypothetical protein